MVDGEHSQDDQPLSGPAHKVRELKETLVGGSGKDTAREQEGCVPVTGKKIGRYAIERVLGTGAMGAVYLARDETLDRRVAVKVPKFPEGSGEEVVKRFYREARSAAAITHPNICAIYDVGEDQGTHYIAMQYIEGHSLADYVDSHCQPQEQIAIVVRKIALAMHEAHSYKLVHRDLKPDNVMIDQRGEPVVMDFGLARRSGQEDVRITREGAISGSPAYMSPEQLEGKLDDVDPRTDIYSLGILFYEGLTGTLPFSGGGSIVALITEVITKNPQHPREHRQDLDPQLCAICMRAMAKNPDERFDSMREMAVAIEQFLNRSHAPSSGINSSGMQASESPEMAVPIHKNRGETGAPRSAIYRAREDCKTVRKHLEMKEYETAADLLKTIAAKKDLEIAKYAEWAAAELPKVRAIVAARQGAALASGDVPDLVPLGQDMLWQDAPEDLSASAVLQPRDRVLGRPEKKRVGPLLIGISIVVVCLLVAVLAFFSF